MIIYVNLFILVINLMLIINFDRTRFEKFFNRIIIGDW